MKRQSVNKLFYNKWSIRVSLQIPYAYHLRYKDGHHRNSLHIDLVAALRMIAPGTYATRYESDRVNFYTNAKSDADYVIASFPNNVVAYALPTPAAIAAFSTPRTIVASKLPHRKYRFKVYLQPHKVSRADKLNWLTWVDSNSDTILISAAVVKWFTDTDWNWDRRYIYVQDEATLIMLKLKNDNALGSIYRYQIG